ncbi:MAG: hypothetical protein JWP87_866 [Labilithrix sp.]|nr:hypothetical protein [Labilithrix sp.]
MRRAAILVALALAFTTTLFLYAVTARAGADVAAPRAQADAILREAEKDDDALEFARALARYDEGRALDPGSPRAPRAEARAAMLRAHAEGDFAPYAALERVRRDPALASDPRAVEELVHAAESFPPGPVRVEVWVLAAEAFAHRFGRPRDAEALLRRVIVDAHTDKVVGQKAARDLVAIHLARGDLAGAEDAVRVAGDRADPQLGRDVRRAVRRRNMHSAAILVLLALVVLAARAWNAAARRGSGARVATALARMWKLAVAYAAYVAIGGALLASGYEAGSGKPFLVFGVALLPILLLARAWGAAGGESKAARSGRATLCALAAASAAFLVLEGIDVAFLEGMGL